jgi:hypothetical protein
MQSLGYLPYPLPSRDGLSKIDLFHNVISHELQHRQDFMRYDQQPDIDYLDPLNRINQIGDHLPDDIDGVSEYNNGVYWYDPLKLICNEYNQYQRVWEGDFEKRARDYELKIIDYLKDWSKGGKQW